MSNKRTIGSLITNIITDVGTLAGNLTDDGLGIASRVAKEGSNIVISTAARSIGTGYNVTRDIADGIANGAKGAKTSLEYETEDIRSDAKAAGQFISKKASEVKGWAKEKADIAKQKADEYNTKKEAEAKPAPTPQEAIDKYPKDVIRKAKDAANATGSEDYDVRTAAATKVLEEWEETQKPIEAAV